MHDRVCGAADSTYMSLHTSPPNPSLEPPQTNPDDHGCFREGWKEDDRIFGQIIEFDANSMTVDICKSKCLAKKFACTGISII